MAVMIDADRRDCWAEFMREVGNTHGLTKPDLRAAIDAADAWINTNAAAFNSALPQPARGALTAAQKAKLLAAVALKRFVKGA